MSSHKHKKRLARKGYEMSLLPVMKPEHHLTSKEQVLCICHFHNNRLDSQSKTHARRPCRSEYNS